MPTKTAENLAAVDLGSNSFHMIVARVDHGRLIVIDRLRDQVQLAAGLRDDGTIDPAAQERAVQSLERFSQRLRELPAPSVRAVGTNTFRSARAGDFLARCETALGAPIEIISGREEARLVYLGVARSLGFGAGVRLVVDIGGGSTECILGERTRPMEGHSLAMGCVSFTKRFFAGGTVDKKAFRRAVLAAELELEPFQRRFREIGWTSAAGSSGTIRAVAAAMEAANPECRQIERKPLEDLARAVVRAETIDAIAALPGVKAERAGIFAAGVAILLAVFDQLDIESMDVSPGALREGLLEDMLGRMRDDDVRETTVSAWVSRFGVDVAHAARVERTALELHATVASSWGIDDDELRDFLAWAARLHEIGLVVAWNGHHRHAAYLIANADLPGFSRGEQTLLASLVGSHRRRVTKSVFDDVPARWRAVAPRLAALLRLAVLLERSRAVRSTRRHRAAARPQALVLTLGAEWLDRHPLTRLDLEDEIGAWSNLGVELIVETTAP